MEINKHRIVLVIDGTRHELIEPKVVESNPCEKCSLKTYCAQRQDELDEEFFICDDLSGNRGCRFVEVEVMPQYIIGKLNEYFAEHFTFDGNGAVVLQDNIGAHLTPSDLIELAWHFWSLGQKMI